MEGLRDVVLVTNAEHVVTYASAAVTEHLGHGPAAVVGAQLDDLVHPDDLTATWRYRMQARGGEQRPPLVVRLRRADGGYRWSACALSTAQDPVHGTGAVTVVSARDATAVVELEERLAAADLRHRTLLGALSEAVLFLDAQLRIELVNEEATALLGRPAGDLLGRGCLEALGVRDETGTPVPVDSPFVSSLLRSSGRTETWPSVLRKDGTRVLLRIRWTPVPGGSTGPRGFVLTLQDALGPRGGAGVHLRQAQAAAGLTPREGDVLEALAAGQDLVTIAARLRISLHSVRGHLKSLMRKLGARSQLQVVVAAARLGMVDVGAPRSPDG